MATGRQQVEQGVQANMTRMRANTMDHQTHVNRRLGLSDDVRIAK